MAENTVTIKRSETSLKSQLIRSYLNEFNANLGLARYRDADIALERIKDTVAELQYMLGGNPSLG